MLNLQLCFCILVRCLVPLHGSPASWHPRVLLNVLENNLVLGPAASLSLLLPGCVSRAERKQGKAGKAGTELGIARLLLDQQLPPCCHSAQAQLGKAVLLPLVQAGS